jgi:hypothetical protein
LRQANPRKVTGPLPVSSGCKSPAGGWESIHHCVLSRLGSGEQGGRTSVVTSTSSLQAGSMPLAASQQVSVGQTIGLAGSTGRSVGDHLHFQIRPNGSPVDPLV